ncbi:MAG: UDP-N-acetylglucosamine 2-epimerase [Acidimicrobiales bacterium]
MIHAVIGTKAEYIKTAPVLRELDRRGVPYRLVDVGQHAALPREFRAPLDVGDPDVRLDTRGDAENVREAAAWMIRVSRHLLRSRRRIRSEIFGGEPGPCLVHGDTPSTLLATLIARRAGLPVAHLESGLRSYHLLHPFPEELIRVAVMRRAAVLYAPDGAAVENLRRMKVRGEVVFTGGNTAVDAVCHAVDPEACSDHSGPGLVAVHRVENLHSSDRLDGLIETLAAAAARGPTRFLVHPPTERALRAAGRWDEVRSAGATVEPLLPYVDFMAAAREARWVITDGGSIQEECAVLGVPTLLWRARTERPDGLDANVVLSNYEPAIIEAFLDDPAAHRRPPRRSGRSPAARVADHLVSISG